MRLPCAKPDSARRRPRRWNAREGRGGGLTEKELAGKDWLPIPLKAYLRTEHGDRAVDPMAALKGAIDPQGLMNPGKIF